MADDTRSTERCVSTVLQDDKLSRELQAHFALYIVNSENLQNVNEEDQGTVSQDLESSCLQKVCCSLPPEQENQLNLFLIRRLRKGAIYTNTGAFSGMDFSIGGNSPAICYYVLLPCKTLVCLLDEADANLEVFRPELAKFCADLEPFIKDPSVGDKLSQWHIKCVQYICNILKVFNSQIASALQLVQCNGDIIVEDSVPQNVEDDVRQFLMACSVAECFVGVPEHPDSSLKVCFDSNGKFSLIGLMANSYCMEWAHLLLELGPNTEPWRLRKLLESFKLKTIKDMNVLKRLLKQAETDHYFLYRAYSFLCQSGNSDMLLRQAALEGSASSDMLSVLQEHLMKCGSSSVITSS